MSDRAERDREYRQQNKQRILEMAAIYRQRNKDRVAESVRRCKLQNGEAYKAKAIERLARPEVLARRRELGAANARRRVNEDVSFRLRGRVSCLVRNTLRGAKKSATTMELLGCSLEELRVHIERQFLPGMAWGNMGKWHIDHIIPLSSFQITDTKCDDFKRAWALSNLRPLWAKDNLRKGSKVETLL